MQSVEGMEPMEAIEAMEDMENMEGIEAVEGMEHTECMAGMELKHRHSDPRTNSCNLVTSAESVFFEGKGAGKGVREKGTGNTGTYISSNFDTWPPYKLLWELCILHAL